MALESEPTAAEALATALEIDRRYSLPGTNLRKQANHTIARNVLD
jgi:hypothetical protein